MFIEVMVFYETLLEFMTLKSLFLIFLLYLWGPQDQEYSRPSEANRETFKKLKGFLLTHLAVRSYQVLMRVELHTQLRSVF